jgi:hypothetical protein
MTTKEPYSYVVLRYVHDVLTREFVNVGLVMAAPKSGLLLSRARKTYGRVKKVFPDLDSDAYKRAVRAVERGLTAARAEMATEGLLKSDQSAREYARIALPLDDSTLQWSPLGAGLTADPQRTFDQLYRRLIGQYDQASESRKTDDDVWRIVASKIKERDIPVELEPKRIQGSADAVEFKHAWKNGHWHAYEPLSFDLADADNIKDKARRWLGHLSAVHDGSPKDLAVHFIVGRPQTEALLPAFRSAVEILRRVPFEHEIVEEDQVDTVVDRIEEEVRQHREKRA